MTERVKKMYESALKNKKFLKAIYEADKDRPPSSCSSNTHKTIFVGIYYGWLVSEYGIDWELHL